MAGNCFIEWSTGGSTMRYELDVDPTSAQWGYKLNTSSYDTYGGRVVQVLSCKIETLTISGILSQPYGTNIPMQFSRYATTSEAFGAFDNRFAVMEEFADAMRQCMECQGETKTPSRFCYPMLDWDGGVYLTSYGNATYDVGSATATYTLKFDVDNGFDQIKEAASTYGLDEIPDGVNWTRNVYNTPVTNWNDVRQALESLLNDAGTSAQRQSIYDYLSDIDHVENDQERNAQQLADLSNRSGSHVTGNLNSGCYGAVATAYGLVAAARTVAEDGMRGNGGGSGTGSEQRVQGNGQEGNPQWGPVVW
jgi:hypothetical protein